MARNITRTDLERVLAEEGKSPGPSCTTAERAGRLWLRLAGIDPDAVPVPAEDAIDARVLEKAREVIVRRFPYEPVGAAGTYPAAGPVAVWLAERRDQLNGR